MAKIGLDSFKYGILTEAANGTATYGAAASPGKAIDCTVSITSNDVKLYADDGIAESDTSFQNGTVSLGIDQLDLETQAALLGHTITSNVITRKSTDIAPYVGIGRVVTIMKGGTLKYKVEFLAKVKFSEPNEENTTKGESIEFGTFTIEGQILTLADGTWSKAETFDTRSAADTYLAGLFGTTPTNP